LGLRILANNRGGQSVGNVLGQSVLGYQQDQQSQQQADLQRQLMQAQIGKLKMQETKPENLVGSIPPERYTPASIAKFLQSKNYGDLVPVQSQINQGGLLGAYDKHVQQAQAAGKEPLSIDEFLKYYTDATTKMPPVVRDVGSVPTIVQPTRGGGATQTALATLPQVAAGAATVAGAETAAKTTADATANARIDLPRQEMNAQQASQAIEGLLKSEGAPRIFGMQGAFPIIPGTKRADAQAYLEQVKGKTFLEAFNSLKGAGQITEVEGQKATQAIARLDKAQSWESAQSALKDLQQVVNAGLSRSRQKAGVTSAPANRVRVDANGNVVR
jgi:hypothetical protein